MTCGFVSYCGRPTDHLEHHGGWSTRVFGVTEQPVFRGRGRARLSSELTPREMRVVAEIIIHGSHKEAAACLGLSVQTVKNHVSTALQRTGAASSSQLAYALGWLTLPAGTYHAEKPDGG